MTRKRFIKLIQAKGLSRNQAQRLAKQVREYNEVGLSYKSVSAGQVIWKNKKSAYYLSNAITGEDLVAYLRKRKALKAKRFDLLTLPIPQNLTLMLR